MAESVGDAGTGVLNVESGGLVVVEDDSWIGYESGSSGTVTVTGENSRWTNSGWLSVGHSGYRCAER